MTMPWTRPRDLKDPEALTGAPKGRDSESAAVLDNKNEPASEVNKVLSEHSLAEDAGYGDPSATYWGVYASEARISDKKFVHTLISDTKAMSLLNGIFSSIIATFLIQASLALQSNNIQETVCLLSQLVSPGNSSQSSSQYCPPYPGKPSPALIRSTILFVISFFMAMLIVVACGLIHQWCDEFMKNAYPRIAPHKRGRVRTYLLQGFERFRMMNIMYGVRVGLFVTAIVFSCGVSDYLYSIYPTVGWYSWSCVITAALMYTTFTISSLIIDNCPYSTALTAPFKLYLALVLFSYRLLRRLPPRKQWPSLWHELHPADETHSLAKRTGDLADKLDPKAMEWLFTDDGFSDLDMDTFLKGLPGYVSSPITKAAKATLPKVLTEHSTLQRIKEHLLTCVTATELSEEAREARVSACVDSLQILPLNWKGTERDKYQVEEKSLENCIQSIVANFDGLCGVPKDKKDLRAFCIRALAFQAFLTKWSPKDPFPACFIPLYKFFSSKPPLDNRPHTQPQDATPQSSEVSGEGAPANDHEGWQVLLHNGPFINLTLLANAILVHHEDIDPSSISMYSNTLNVLRREFRINRVRVTDDSWTLFDKVHEETRMRVEDEVLGFSNLIPLLEVLDAVDGGRCISPVFQGEGDNDYYFRADLVFGKDHLRNPDLFRAFAKCLPVFLTKAPEESAKLLMGLIRRNYLWTSLQGQLSNSLRPNNSVPAILRIFERCCIVIDAAFVALEKSKVDWRATDFGELAHYFELFATDCFRGVFLERAVGFRVGLIKARFCRAVLAQFLDELNREGTVVFRSHWDVASLARVFYSLSVGEGTDVEFWKSFVHGGPVGPELMEKTHTSLYKAARDGPLLNFCRLGHLGLMAVPFKGSGLKDADLKKLLDLMEKVKDDPDLPLTRASAPVWEELRELRDEAADICNRLGRDDQIEILYRSGKEQDEENKLKKYISALLETINTVYNRPRSSSPAREVDSIGVIPTPPYNPLSEFRRGSRIPYPHLPPQIEPGGRIALPYSASFLPALSPHSGSADVASSGITSHLLTSPLMPYNTQPHHSSVDLPPSSPSSSSSTSDTRSDPFGDEGASGSPPASQEVK